VKKNVYGLTFVLALLILSVTGVLLVGSVMGQNGSIVYFPSVPQITINADGTITPQTDKVSRSGNTYTLTEDLNGIQLTIECSNIVFDGKGHSISLMDSGSNPGIHISNSVNSTIRDVEVFTPLYAGIAMYGCSSCHITGVKTSGYIELRQSSYNIISKNIGPLMLKSGDNKVYWNNITGLALSGSNDFYANNVLLVVDNPAFVDSGNAWDNGSIGNYWSDYLDRYPDASEIGNTGIANLPYVIDENNVDYFPLMYPYDIEKDEVALPERESFPTALVIAPIASVVVFGVGLLVYFRKRRK
jgi:hypothetical protein